MLVSQSEKQHVSEQLLNSLLNQIMLRKKDINVTNYINIWLSLARI